MRDYALFGGCLSSDVELPALRPSLQRAADWTLRTVPRLAVEPLHLLGEARICKDIRIRLYRHRNGYRLTYSDSGSFDIVDDGRTIEWLPAPEHRIELVRMDVINFVMATALHAAGTLCLHASAVLIGGAAVAFLGPKRSGKSTLAKALASEGVPIVCDDLLAVRHGTPPTVSFGVTIPRLEPDVAAWFDEQEAIGSAQRSSAFASGEHERALALEALYVLTPTVMSPGAPRFARRARLTPAASVLALQSNARIAHLLGVEGAASLLKSTARLASAVPVYALTIPRELDVLPRVRRALLDWHSTPDKPSPSLPAGHRRFAAAHRDPSLRSG